MKSYVTVVASDVDRDGLGVELTDSAGVVVAEVFRSDRDHTLVVSTLGNDLPFALLQMLLERAITELDPFEDGTPLRSANDGTVQRSPRYGSGK